MATEKEKQIRKPFFSSLLLFVTNNNEDVHTLITHSQKHQKQNVLTKKQISCNQQLTAQQTPAYQIIHITIQFTGDNC